MNTDKIQQCINMVQDIGRNYGDLRKEATEELATLRQQLEQAELMVGVYKSNSATCQSQLRQAREAYHDAIVKLRTVYIRYDKHDFDVTGYVNNALHDHQSKENFELNFEGWRDAIHPPQVEQADYNIAKDCPKVSDHGYVPPQVEQPRTAGEQFCETCRKDWHNGNKECPLNQPIHNRELLKGCWEPKLAAESQQMAQEKPREDV
jgi:hypothetical protein